MKQNFLPSATLEEGNWIKLTFAKASGTVTGDREKKQLAIYVVQNLHAGEQKSHWGKTNEGNYHIKLCVRFVCLVPVRLSLAGVVVLYHVNCWLQRTYWTIADRRVPNNYPRSNCGTNFGSSSLLAFMK